MGAAGALLLGACSPLESLSLSPLGPGGGGGGGAGGAGGSGGSGLNGPDSLVLDVVATGLDDFISQQPAAGAVVALDLPAGEDRWRRVEQTVGADGRVTFTGLDWSLPGSAAVTAYLAGYVPQSFAGLTGASAAALSALDGTDVLTVYLLPVDPEMVVLSGLATPMVDPDGNWLTVRATTRQGHLSSEGPGWALRVRAAAPTTLVAREGGWGMVNTSPRGASFKPGWWAVVGHEVGSSDENGILIDMGAPPPVLTTVSGSFAVPSHGISGFFEEGGARVGVNSSDSGGTTLVGITQWVDVTADGSAFEYLVTHITLAAVELPRSYVRMYRGVGSTGLEPEQSKLLMPGYPTEGLQPGVLPEPAQLAAAVPVTLGEALTWEMNAVDAADPQLRLQIVMREQVGGTRRWQLYAPPGTTELRLPAALPSNADPDEVFGPNALEAFVEHCEPVLTPQEYQGMCGRWSQSAPVRILRPAAELDDSSAQEDSP